MPRLRVLAGPTFHASSLTEIKANSDVGFPISTEFFEGRVAVYLKGFGFGDEEGTVGESAYFEREERRDVTWSVQFQGGFFFSSFFLSFFLFFFCLRLGSGLNLDFEFKFEFAVV